MIRYVLALLTMGLIFMSFKDTKHGVHFNLSRHVIANLLITSRHCEPDRVKQSSDFVLLDCFVPRNDGRQLSSLRACEAIQKTEIQYNNTLDCFVPRNDGNARIATILKCTPKHERICTAVENQLRMYPKSTLQDLYKNFFQDYFGPGHIVSDTLSAGAYLNAELASFEQASGAYYEPTGYNSNFYRVNLSVIKEGIISRDAFFDAFFRSVNDIQTITFEAWKKEWKEIDSVIHTMNLSLANYTEEREKIFSLLEQGKYVMHHSEQFSGAYDPHYRIIRRDIFLKEILPLLP